MIYKTSSDPLLIYIFFIFIGKSDQNWFSKTRHGKQIKTKINSSYSYDKCLQINRFNVKSSRSRLLDISTHIVFLAVTYKTCYKTAKLTSCIVDLK